MTHPAPPSLHYLVEQYPDAQLKALPPDGVQWLYLIGAGHRVSVIHRPGSIGYDEGLWEMRVDESEPEGYLDEVQVEARLANIAKAPTIRKPKTKTLPGAFAHTAGRPSFEDDEPYTTVWEDAPVPTKAERKANRARAEAQAATYLRDNPARAEALKAVDESVKEWTERILRAGMGVGMTYQSQPVQSSRLFHPGRTAMATTGTGGYFEGAKVIMEPARPKDRWQVLQEQLEANGKPLTRSEKRRMDRAVADGTFTTDKALRGEYRDKLDDAPDSTWMGKH